MNDRNNWEVIIGLETHAQLNTQTKLFSPAPNRFGDEPNTNIHPVCLGLPGTLPVLNKEAVRKAVQIGCALGSKISTFSRFDRKSYFYPDSPRNFQITQFYHPILLGGEIRTVLDDQFISFEIERAHLEDDAGMLKHFQSFAGIDYNRAGAPLIEIVSKPCMHSPKEARAYISALKSILEYIGASECNMEEGHLRIDVNVSVRPYGETTLRPKAEIKNMNSITNLELALQAEIDRQIALYESHPLENPQTLMKQATYRWDPELKQTIKMRSKETAADYRYFPEPDIPAIKIDDAFIQKIRQTLPELPQEKKERFIQKLHLSEYQADTLISDKKLCIFYESGISSLSNAEKLAQSLCNWVCVEFVGRFSEHNKGLTSSGISPKDIAQLVNMIDSGIITGKIAKKVADEMCEHIGVSPEKIVSENPDYRPVSDQSQIEQWVREVLAQNPQAIEDYRAGKGKAYGFLVGQVMAKSRGKADPSVVNALLKENLQ